jgi:hypothetical protein
MKRKNDNFVVLWSTEHIGSSVFSEGVGIAKLRTTGNGLDNRGSIPAKDKIFLFYTTSRPALGPIQPPNQCLPGTLSPGVNRPGREAGRSPQSSAAVKNGGAILPLPYMSSWHIA